MTVFTGWREQYERMFRSRERLNAVGTGKEFAGSDQARDALVHFYQDAYHLKDWLKNDRTVQAPAQATIEADVRNSPIVAVCADIANGSKHLQLTSTKTGDLNTAIVGQSVVVRPGTLVARTIVPSDGALSPKPDPVPPMPALHSWTIQSNNSTYEALSLADQVVIAWEDWLRTQQLLP